VSNLVGVVAHVGTVDDGHYFSIVQAAHGDWYICDDTDVELFDLSSLPRRAFGVCREGDGEVSVAYLLFYARAGMALIKPNIPRDLGLS
jgi:ubiquitin C-terminal hydrolase